MLHASPLGRKVLRDRHREKHVKEKKERKKKRNEQNDKYKEKNTINIIPKHKRKKIFFLKRVDKIVKSKPNKETTKIILYHLTSPSDPQAR